MHIQVEATALMQYFICIIGINTRRTLAIYRVVLGDANEGKLVDLSHAMGAFEIQLIAPSIRQCFALAFSL